MKRNLLTLTLLLLTTLLAGAQEYRFEVGPALGMSGYLGEANTSNLWKRPGLVAGGVIRYILNSRWAFKGNLIYANIKGDTRGQQSQFPDGHHYSFSSSVYDLSAQAEFNFFHFGSGARYKQYKRISPYMVAGIGLAYASTKGRSEVAFTIPLGIGVKYKIKERLNIGLEFTMRKSFGDKIDNLNDLYLVKHSFGKNTDWYSFTMVTLTYEFSKRCVKCHYVE